jgi:biotin synthase-related radical SAM superfamily protein
MRIILANNVGQISHARMEIGSVTAHLIPNMTTLFAYETYADSCRKEATAAPTAAPAATKPPKKASSKKEKKQ